MSNVFYKAPYAKHEILKKIRHHLKSVKMAWQRATKGYCDRDLWDLGHFYLEIFEGSLQAFKNNLHGTPGRLGSVDFTEEQWEEAHKIWVNHLSEIERHFHNVLHYRDVFKNEYEEEWHKINPFKFEKLENGLVEWVQNTDPKVEEIREKFSARAAEIERLRKKELRLGFEKLLETFDDLWD